MVLCIERFVYALEHHAALQKGMSLVYGIFLYVCVLKEMELNEGCENRKSRRKSSSLGANVLVLSNLGKVLMASF